MSPTGPAGRPTPDRIAPGELGLLRQAHLRAERLALQARLGELALRRVVLRLERKYGLLGLEATIDVHTGRITRAGGAPAASEEESRGPEHNADAGAP